MKMRICSKCNKQNSENAWNCVDCGTTLSIQSLVEIVDNQSSENSQIEETSSISATPSATHTDNAAIFCSNCGEKLSSEANFCWKCGAQVQTLKLVSDATKIEQKKSMSTPVASQKEFRSISCAVGNCDNPVIGQCDGYKRKCGSFYCAVHSKDKLCSECSELKTQDDLVDEYYQLAQYLEKHPSETVKWAGLVLNLLYLTFCGSAFLLSQMGPKYAGSLGWVAIISLVTLLAVGIYTGRTKRRLHKEILAQTIAAKPHFAEFYRLYKSERRKEQLRMAGSMAMGIVAAAADEAVKSHERQRQEEMVRRAVDDELHRHGL